MNAIRIRTQVDQNNSLIIRNLPLSKGKRVEVIILDADRQVQVNERFPLRGQPIRYKDSFGSAK
ncbi:hypothetical protein GGR92_004580 [Spirosoma lacussanchae]|uniref:hypothetical protein n=1 Tax=Spirosoma lacussanchae TaxID=1884249 RepID=UPI0011095180|nr:hypothetical protein [Spirosoma lacussanchae]